MKEKKTHSDYSQGNIEQNLIDVEALLRKPEQCSCGEKFQYTGLGHYQCPRCKSTFRNEYAIVRDFIDEFGSAYSILEIAERTGVPRSSEGAGIVSNLLRNVFIAINVPFFRYIMRWQKTEEE